MTQTPTRKPLATTIRGRDRARHVLEQFGELQRFFSSTTALSEAVGVTRDTILAWRRGDASRIREANRVRVAHLLRVCLAATDHLPADELVGRWMRSPQTFLYGGTPIEFLDDGGDPDFLIESMQTPAPATNERALQALAAADRDLAELVEPERRHNADVRVAPAGSERIEVVDLMDALRRSVAAVEEARLQAHPRRRARVLTARKHGGGWLNIIDGEIVVPSLWRSKRAAERFGKRLATSAHAEHVTVDETGREVSRPAAKAGGRR